MGIFCSRSRHTPNQNVEEIYNNVRTGDIFLFSGKSIFSSLVRCNSLVKHWSHVGIALEYINNNGDREVFLLDSTISNFMGGKNGVHATPLRDRLNNYSGYLICYRQLNVNVSVDEKYPKQAETEIRQDWTKRLFNFYSHYNKAPYEMDPTQLYGSTLRINQGNDKAFFCTEFVAAALKAMGILVSEEYSDNYTLYEFSEEGSLSLYPGLYYSKQIYHYD